MMTTKTRFADGGWRITGRTVLIGMVAFFATVAAVNGTMIYLAVSSHTGVVTTSSYRAGNGYQQDIDAAHAQRVRDWRVDAVIDRSGDGAAVEVTVRDRNGAPVTGLTVDTLIRSPVNVASDLAATLVETETGRYRGRLDPIASGNWTVLIDAELSGARMFHSENRVFVR